MKGRVLGDDHPDDLLAQPVAQLRVGHGEELLDPGQLVEFFVEIGEFVFDDLPVFVLDLLARGRSADLRTGSRLHTIVQNAVPALQILIPLIVDLFFVGATKSKMCIFSAILWTFICTFLRKIFILKFNFAQ